MDEECLRPGDPTDMSFLSKMNDNLENNERFISHKKSDAKTQKVMGRDEFRLVHYAGEVTYNVVGFLDKNNDLLFRDIREVMTHTKNSITKAVFTELELHSKKRPDTAVTQFKNSLNQLMAILMSKEPSYIRCIKPNETKSSAVFDDKIVQHQVKYLGLMENLRVRRAGFAYRRPYNDFLQRYKCLCKQTWPNFHGNPRDGVQLLVDKLNYEKDEYRMGKTKIFIRSPRTLFKTEDAFQVRKNWVASLIQARYKGKLQRRKYQKMRLAAIIVQKYMRRHLARKEYIRRKNAANAVRMFIKGFMTRNGPRTALNARFVALARKQWLLRLAKSLPTRLLDKRWPPCSPFCEEASKQLHHLYRLQLGRRYRQALSEERKKNFEDKILAEKLFKDKKKSYQQSFPQWFVNDRLNSEDKPVKESFERTLNGEKIRYATSVTKYDRRGYKPRSRVLIMTGKKIYLLEGKNKNFKLKHQIGLEMISELVVTSEADNLLLVRIPTDMKKDKGDLILSVPHLIEAVTKFIDITPRSNVLQIVNAGSISHNMISGKSGTITVTSGTTGDLPAMSKDKSGHLVVVG